MSDETKKQFSADEYLENFAYRFYKTLNHITKRARAYYNPLYANDLMQDINSNPSRPTPKNLKKWLEDPKNYEKELRDVSQFLRYNIQQYDRVIAHFANILSLNYELVPLTPYPIDEKGIKEYNRIKKRANQWLKRFRPKTQFINVLHGVCVDGVRYYYIRESDDYIDLQEMPQDFSIINGRTSLGYTYAFDMTYFARYPESFREYAPEFYLWFKDVLDDYQEVTLKTIYKPMPPEKSAVFKIEDWNAVAKPPFTGTFKDALQIQDYKDLLKLKTELDTWKVIMMEIPKDTNGTPTVDAELMADFTAIVQAQMPDGAYVASTPAKPIPIDFNQAQNMNNISGYGEQNFWSSIGVAGNQYGTDSKSGLALKYSNLADYNYMKPMYSQFERFVNFHLSLIPGKYKFGVKFHGCSFFEDEEYERALTFSQNTGRVERLYAAMGYEPYHLEALGQDSFHSDIRKFTIPMDSPHVQSGEGGRPKANETKLQDSGITTRDGGYNDE